MDSLAWALNSLGFLTYIVLQDLAAVLTFSGMGLMYWPAFLDVWQ